MAATIVGVTAPSHAQSVRDQGEQHRRVEDVSEPSSADRGDIIVTGRSNEIVKPYAGGQVATGARLGLLGDVETKKSPFSVASYTEQLILDRQSNTVSKALELDPSIRTTQGAGSPFDTFYIRGFPINEGTSGELAYDGVFGVGPSFRIFTDYVERIEVLKGPSAALTGASPNGGIGGVVNVVPKRAEDDLTRATVNYTSALRLGTKLDVGRRFGDQRQWGVRIVASIADGDTAFRRQAERSAVTMLTLDHQGRRLRASLSVYGQIDHITAPLRPYSLATGASIPQAPSGRTNLTQRWEFSKIDDRGGLFKAEYDLSRAVTIFANFGGKRSDVNRYFASSRSILNAQGDTITAPGLYVGNIKSYAVETGIRAEIATGIIRHKLAAQYSLYDDVFHRYLSPTTTPYRSNIYLPGRAPYIAPADIGLRPRLSDSRLEGFTIADTMMAMDERILLTIGLRRQNIKAQNFLANVGTLAASYDRSATTPVVGLVVRPNEQISLYGNYVQGLSRGDVAPALAANSGEILAPYVAKQIEAGVKFDFGQFGGAISLFRITRPIGELSSGDANSPRIYAQTGEQRVRGVEASVYGNLTSRLSVIGGATVLDASLSKTALTTNIGNRPIGVPKLQVNMGADWKPWQRFSVNSSIIWTGRQFIDTANRHALPAWARMDVGLGYVAPVGQRDITLRANVSNVTNNKYWTGVASFGTFFQGNPRTLSFSAAVEL
ncbi:TonB-dependent siderophore receptor [Sphingobium sp. JS3065]|uniref:TonB-dependent receptor n=1 Tax=Sphingobium sp. JS3065 TaxID=2970925 RepID=UPI0022653ACD|nr:TonB-dependent siderophore receptor [Sphingobium sp. JS3065]UZW54499.1 TonB-dependent siderophore receptor [Sphingobium sp. JS3065]